MENTEQILDAPQTETMRLKYAGFWIRTGAYLIDGVLLGIVNFMLTFMLADAGFLAPILNMVIGISYFAFLESSEYQGTLGKMAVGLKVGDANGEQLSFGNALGRYFAKIISALLLCIGFMMVGWDEKNQGLHDKLASTYVFYK